MPKRLTKDSFIKKAKVKHSNKYDYSKVEYKNNTTKVCIICPEHGEFWQTPHDHLSGNGCKECGLKSRSDKRRKSTPLFIEQAKQVHGDKYDYSKTEYVNAHTKVCIICPEHGEFYIEPASHVRQKQGCPACANKRKGQYRKLTLEKFIERSNAVHNNKYDYSKVEYVNNYTLVEIICPTHGSFMQKPNDHLTGHGCNECSKTFGITEKKVYEILKEHFEDIEYQKKFDFLKSRTSYQTIDFFIPSINVGIEYQGSQHFMANDRFGGVENFKKVKERDIRKYNKCKNNGISIYYLSFESNIQKDYFEKIYTDIDELIKTIKTYISSP